MGTRESETRNTLLSDTSIPAGEALLIPASFFLTGSGTQDEFSNYLNDIVRQVRSPSDSRECETRSAWMPAFF